MNAIHTYRLIYLKIEKFGSVFSSSPNRQICQQTFLEIIQNTFYVN